MARITGKISIKGHINWTNKTHTKLIIAVIFKHTSVSVIIL